MHLRPLADHARRPDGGRLQALRDHQGHQEAQGPEAWASQRRQLPVQNVIQSVPAFLKNIKLDQRMLYRPYYKGLYFCQLMEIV